MNLTTVRPLPTDISAQKNPVMDMNNEKCALVKVECVLNGMKFRGNVIGDISKTDNTYWVYLTPGTKRLTVFHPKLQSLVIDFKESVGESLEGGQTYFAQVSIPEALYVALISAQSQPQPQAQPQAQAQPQSAQQKPTPQAAAQEPREKIIEQPKEENLAILSAEDLFDKGEKAYEASNYEWAAKYYEASAEKGNKYAQLKYGEMLLDALGVERDIQKGVEMISSAADKNEPNAKFDLSMMLFDGTGVAQDTEKAMLLLKSAAQDGLAQAQYRLGMLYATGNEVHQNLEVAKLWLEKASAQKYVDAKRELGKLTKKFRFFKQAATLGDSYSKFILGCASVCGYGGREVFSADEVEENANKAFNYFLESAEQGLPEAQYALGLCYLNGFGVEKNQDEGQRFIAKAEENGFIANDEISMVVDGYNSFAIIRNDGKTQEELMAETPSSYDSPDASNDDPDFNWLTSPFHKWEERLNRPLWLLLVCAPGALIPTVSSLLGCNCYSFWFWFWTVGISLLLLLIMLPAGMNGFRKGLNVFWISAIVIEWLLMLVFG